MSDNNFGHPYLTFTLSMVGEAQGRLRPTSPAAAADGVPGKPHGDPKCGCGPCLAWIIDRWGVQAVARGRP